MTLGSLFDGLGGWQLAGIHAGVQPIWSSEIEKFPCAVTKHHFPDTVQLGDITKIDADRLEPVDIVCAGSPCQDLSVAGKREGLKGERSGLFMDAIRLVRRLRERTGKPRYFVWENVPGAFSSNKGLDFRAVLEEISQTEIPMPPGGKWATAGVVEWGEGSLAWRVLDAQYWGVPQRRKRIFLVADFTGRSAGEILFEPEGMSRDSAESRGERKDTPEGVGNGVESTSGVLTYKFYESHPQDSRVTGPLDVAPTVSQKYGTGGNNVPIVMRMRSGCDGGGKGPLLSVNKSLTLAANCNDQTVFCLAGNIIDREPQNGGNQMGVSKDISYTLNTMDRHAVCGVGVTDGKAGTLDANYYKGQGVRGGIERTANVESRRQIKTVRRLTPLEAERLQGLPDGYTLIDDKSCSDSARYKALGNGMAAPCALYVMKRIVECNEEESNAETR